MNATTMSETALAATETAEIEDTAHDVTCLLPETKQIPLSRLVPSPANVRRVNAAVNVEELADSIDGRGRLRGKRHQGGNQNPEGGSRSACRKGSCRKGMASRPAAFTHRG